METEVIEIKFDKEFKQYVRDNCPYHGACEHPTEEFTCPYLMMDGFPCRYVAQLYEEYIKKINGSEAQLDVQCACN